MRLKVDNIFVSYGKRNVLNGISLSVEVGEILAIVGHNGAGKTTLMKSIMGLIPIESGKIMMDELDITGKTTREVGQAGIKMLPAEFRGIFPSRQVIENLKVALPHEVARDKKRTSEAIEYCLNLFPALREKLRQPAGSLSGGQQQMVAMAIALIGSPKVLLLDEPSIGLQPNLVADMLNEVRDLSNKAGLSVIIVEQNVKVALSVADRVMALRTGRILHESPVEDITLDELWNLF